MQRIRSLGTSPTSLIRIEEDEVSVKMWACTGSPSINWTLDHGNATLTRLPPSPWYVTISFFVAIVSYYEFFSPSLTHLLAWSLTTCNSFLTFFNISFTSVFLILSYFYFESRLSLSYMLSSSRTMRFSSETLEVRFLFIAGSFSCVGDSRLI